MSDQDLSEFFKYSRPKRKPCVVGFAKTQLKPAENKQLEAALSESSGIITNSAIQEWLSRRDLTASVGAIVSHRKGTCTCNHE